MEAFLVRLLGQPSLLGWLVTCCIIPPSTLSLGFFLRRF
jgi:hypothetical protein